MLRILLLLASGLVRTSLALHRDATGESASTIARLVRTEDHPGMGHLDSAKSPSSLAVQTPEVKQLAVISADGNIDTTMMEKAVNPTDTNSDTNHGLSDPAPAATDATTAATDATTAVTDATTAQAQNAQTTAQEPVVKNGGFEEGAITEDHQFSNSTDEHANIPGWRKTGNVVFIKTLSDEYQQIAASHGDYLVGLGGKGAGIPASLYQTVADHTIGNWYRLIWNSAIRATEGHAMLKVSIAGEEKFVNHTLAEGTLTWYEVEYKAPAANVDISFVHWGPDENLKNTIYLDAVSVKPVELWDNKLGMSNSMGTVLLQKINCDGYPSDSTCTRGHFLTVGDYSEGGLTNIVESEVADKAAVWEVSHTQGGRWSFKSHNLKAPDGGDATWYLHSDYTDCQAKNAFLSTTSSFHVVENSLGYHEVSNQGTACGTLFAIQKFHQGETTGT